MKIRNLALLHTYCFAEQIMRLVNDSKIAKSGKSLQKGNLL